jgi:hypothetical protein
MESKFSDFLKQKMLNEDSSSSLGTLAIGGVFTDNNQNAQIKISEVLDVYNSIKVQNDVINGVKSGSNVADIANKAGITECQVNQTMYDLIKSLFSEGKSIQNGGPVDKEQLAKGIMVESEHSSNPLICRKISLDHLAENKDYYIYLEEMEKKMEADKNKDKVPEKEAVAEQIQPVIAPQVPVPAVVTTEQKVVTESKDNEQVTKNKVKELWLSGKKLSDIEKTLNIKIKFKKDSSISTHDNDMTTGNYVIEECVEYELNEELDFMDKKMLREKKNIKIIMPKGKGQHTYTNDAEMAKKMVGEYNKKMKGVMAVDLNTGKNIITEEQILNEGIDFFNDPYDRQTEVSLSYTSFAGFAKKYLPISNKKYNLASGDIHKVLCGKSGQGKILDNIKKDILSELKKIKLDSEEKEIWGDTVKDLISIFSDPNAGQS